MTRIHGIEIELRQFRLTTTITLDRRILDDACVALELAASSRPNVVAGPWYENGPGRVVRIANGLAVAAAVVLVAFVLWSPSADTSNSSKSTPEPKAPSAANIERRLAKERIEIETMVTARDVMGLVTMLERGLPESQRMAAVSLGRIGDGRALAALSRLAQNWQGDPLENPFVRAVEQITHRVQETEPNVPEPNEGPISQVVPQVAPAPVLSGTITDSDSGESLEGVRVQLHSQRFYETTTDSNGLYIFESVEEGPYLLILRAPEHITRADWEQEDNLQRVQLQRRHPVVKDFSLVRGSTIVVKIVNKAGQPVSGTRVFAAYISDEVGRGPKRPIRSGDDGRAVLGGLRADEYWVTVSHPDYALAGRSVVLEKPGQIEPAEFVLEKGIDVVGVATCSDSLPATGWRVDARPKWWHSVYSWPGEDRVAEDGTFVLPHVVPGLHRLEVYIPFEGGARGIWSTDVNLPPETGLLDLQIPKPSPYGRVSISGSVVFKGGSYDRGVWIHAYGDAGGSGSTYLEAGQTEFTLTDLVPGLYELGVQAGGQKRFKNIKAPSEGVVLEVSVEQQEGVMGWAAPTEKPPSLILSGTVVDEAGRPVAGATVSDRYARAETAEAKQLGATDAEGHFTIADVPGGRTDHWFVFRHPDYARTMRCIEMAEEGATETRIVLTKGGAVEGIVYDWQGRPLPEADVYFMDESHFPYWKQNRARLGKATTDDDGYYRIEHLPEELCYAFREDPDNQLGVALSMILPRAGQTLRLDMGGPWKTSGRLVRAGEPVANIKLLVTYHVGVVQGFKAYAVSDALGRFSFYGLPTGRRPIYWAVPGGKDWNRWIELTTVDFERGADLELGDREIPVADVTVDLVFVDESIPVDRWDVHLYEVTPRGSLSRQVGQLKPRMDHSDPFVFAGIGAGDYDVVVSRQGYPTIRDGLRVEPGQSHAAIAVAIPSGTGRISGEVVFSSDSRTRTVLLQSDDGRIATTVALDPDGSFEVEHLPAGEYRLWYSRLEPSVASVHLVAGGHETVHIVAGPSDERGQLRVLIVTAEGWPLATPDVWLERGGRVIEPSYNNDDITAFGGAPGTYTLCAHYPGFRSVRQTVELTPVDGRTTQEVLKPLVVTMHRE